MDLTFLVKRWLFTAQQLRTTAIVVFCAIFAAIAGIPPLLWYLLPHGHSLVLTFIPVFVSVLFMEMMLFNLALKRLKEL
jgi:hypothetical protein